MLAIRISDLSFTYSGAKVPSLRHLCGTLEYGQVLAIMGGAGSGKSSLCCALNGIIPHLLKGNYRGTVQVGGKTVGNAGCQDLARRIGTLLQDYESQLLSASVELELAFGLENTAHPRACMRSRVEQWLAKTGLQTRRNFHPGILSGGQKQLLACAAVLALKPELVIMDEPTTDLDPLWRRHILAFLQSHREQGGSVVVADHDSESAEQANVVWLMHQGEIIASGPPERLMSDVKLLERASVRPPELVHLMHKCGYPPRLWQLDEAAAALAGKFSLRRNLSPPTSQITVPAQYLVAARGLAFGYPQSGQQVLGPLDLTVQSGEFVGVLGRNGSGKTTLLKLICGLLRADAGALSVFGRPISAYSRAELARLIGFVFQNPDHQIFASTVAEEAGFSLRQFSFGRKEIEERTEEALHVVGLSEYRDHDPVKLSRGQRQRVAVASILVTRPQLIVLDEPTKGLDFVHQRQLVTMLQHLHRQGHTLVMSTHSIPLVAECSTRAVVMEGGRISVDSPTGDALSGDNWPVAALPLPPLIALRNRLGLRGLSVDELATEIKAR